MSGVGAGPDQPLGRIIIITGLSGSGKSTALNALEDCGFFCMDNLPVRLLPKFLALYNESNAPILKLGVVMDLREREFIHAFPDVFASIQREHYDLHVVFLEATDEALVKRFSETRRRHPLADQGHLLDGIRRERTLMTPVREAAQAVVDTSGFNGHQLRDHFSQKYGQAEVGQRMAVELISFGFKYGLPPEADILMDVRFLPNPYYLDDLRELDGRHPRIVEYVLAGEDAALFVERFVALLEMLIPRFRREGKSYLAIAIGCTGGQHRSVAVVNELAARLESIAENISVRHRDIVRRREA